jgi:hypothetical protein
VARRRSRRGFRCISSGLIGGRGYRLHRLAEQRCFLLGRL